MPHTYVIKLGGSAVSTENTPFDFGYLAKLKHALLPSIANGEKFFITLGGGVTMRKYRDLAKAGGVDKDIELHWIGTTVNVLHAVIAKAYFNEWADEEVMKFEEYYDDTPFEITKSLRFGGGGRPGHSGDVDAVVAAQKLGAKIVYSLKNVDGVYSADPKKDPTAALQEKLTWTEYLNIIGNPTEHTPGANYPIDPIASKMAMEAGISFIILGSMNLENFNKALKGEPFHGTIVQ